MQAECTLTRTPDGQLRIRHSSETLGDVEITDASRASAVERMQRELQYRYELCPCSGVSMGAVQMQIHEES